MSDTDTETEPTTPTSDEPSSASPKKPRRFVATPDPEEVTSQLVAHRDHMMTAIAKRLGPKSPIKIMTAVDAAKFQSRVDTWVPTGIFGLDFILSDGKGLPTGRVAELFGPESAGKTALCEFITGIFKSLGFPVSYLDYERSLDESHLACYGVTLNDLITPDCPTLEDGWDFISAALNVRCAERTKGVKLPPSLFVVDSVAQAVPRDELEEEEHGDSHVGLTARAMSKGFRKHTREISEGDSLLLFVNQERDVIGATGYGPQTTTPGGRATKFACSLRIRVTRKEQIKKGENVVGHVIGISTVKNKHAPPRQTCQIHLSYTTGINVARSNFLWFYEHGYIRAAGQAGYRFKGSSDPFRKVDFGEWVEAHRELILKARDDIYAKLRAGFKESLDSDPDDDEDGD